MQPYRPKNNVRFVTASSLFDGHDATINIIRRLLQASGVEVIHLGHNRSVQEVVNVAIQEDVQGIAITSYQGGHMEYFKYLHDMLQERGYGHIRIFGGGGGVIVPAEQKDLEEYGIAKIFSPEDGRVMGLEGMIRFMVERADFSTLQPDVLQPDLPPTDFFHIICHVSRNITRIEQEVKEGKFHPQHDGSPSRKIPVIGLTGTGGAGKSSLMDELIRRFLYDFPDKKFVVLSVDPSKGKTGGALLGDRIRMNSIRSPRVYMRSMASRSSQSEISDALVGAIECINHYDLDLIILETSGIGQSNARIVDLADISVYVMTSEYGAASQLEKIEMLDYADLVAINKFERRGSADALRDVRKQYRRSHLLPDEVEEEQLPVYGTIASRFNDEGTTIFYQALLNSLQKKTGRSWDSRLLAACLDSQEGRPRFAIIPSERSHYLAEIVKVIRSEKLFIEKQAKIASQLYQLNGALDSLRKSDIVSPQGDRDLGQSKDMSDAGFQNRMEEMIQEYEERFDEDCRKLLKKWQKVREQYTQNELITEVRGKKIKQSLVTYSLSGTRIPRVALPRYSDSGDVLRWLLKENLPGHYPFTAGVFPLKRMEEEPRRQFAGEGTPERTNRRFHYLSKDDTAKRLSTAFDSITLYGEDPDWRPDIYGKIGESGVSVCTLDDMKKLFSGFDLCHPQTSVSMTINGPAPIILAMYLNAAIDQQMEAFEKDTGNKCTGEELERIRVKTFESVRGTVQADILKEDQGQNTCIFSIEFALKMMGDMQEYFVKNNVRNYYSVSISGYHIAEAGANPISQLAFTLANGFTYVEYYLSRGMIIDDFAPNLSFFFSNGLDPEYSVIGRVARRIWARAMKNHYGGNERSQKLKYHIQTSGRSLHAQEMDFNDIRTTLQALLAIYDNCNSLHTNAYDEAITTPTEDSVRRAIAIQLIINREFGMAKNENPLQGSFIMEELTDLVEEAVLGEFMKLDDRGGVLGAMELHYQRGKIQDESMLYERKKHSGELPIIGVNTFLNQKLEEEDTKPVALIRATKEEKNHQIQQLGRFKERYNSEAEQAIQKLQEVALTGGNIFSELMNTVRYASLGQITHALYDVGGEYRRNL